MERMSYLMLLLNPSTNSFNNGASDFNAPGWEDVVSAMSMGDLDTNAYYLGLAKYCMDQEAETQLINMLEQQGVVLANTNGWRCKSDQFHRLAQLACKEFIESKACSECNGRRTNAAGQVCESCLGTGVKRLSQRAKYRFANIDKRNWERRWQERYETLFQLLCDAESSLLSHLKTQLCE